MVAIDGTGMLTFHERHCEHCLTRKVSNGTTLYYHPVLEAKLVTANGFSFSLMTEFIENNDPEASKQDCELKAFYRLSERLKKRFPRLLLCLLLDGLFAGGPTLERCEQYQWKYFIVLKDDDLPTVHQEFEALCQIAPDNRLHLEFGKKQEIEQDYRWMDEIAYVDTQGKEHQLSVLECLETKPNKQGQEKTTKFKWLTNFDLTIRTVNVLANEGGRLRWKIENEGFNAQKNGGFELEHAYSEDEIAAMNMAVGASYAGVRAMTATSGGGFCLMVEGLALAGMTETPVVVVLGQRPGPATGLPTRTEQGELWFALHAGHGEFCFLESYCCYYRF